jgi:hypothetical protein
MKKIGKPTAAMTDSSLKTTNANGTNSKLNLLHRFIFSSGLYVRLRDQLTDWVKEHLSKRSWLGLLVLFLAFVPDTDARIRFWRHVYDTFHPTFSSVRDFMFSSLGRVFLVVTGLAIIWFDSRLVANKPDKPEVTPVAPPAEEQRSPLQVENCWVEKCRFDEDYDPDIPFGPLFDTGETHTIAVVDYTHDNFEFETLYNVTAKIVYFDRGKPYVSVTRAVWIDGRRAQVLQPGHSAKLVIAIAKDETCFTIGDDQESGSPYPKLNLRKVNDFVTVQLSFSFQRGGLGTHKTAFGLRTKKLQIVRATLSDVESIGF